MKKTTDEHYQDALTLLRVVDFRPFEMSEQVTKKLLRQWRYMLWQWQFRQWFFRKDCSRWIVLCETYIALLEPRVEALCA